MLVDAADAAYPPDYSKLPSSVRTFLGYVGGPGCTPHIWTPAEAREAKDKVGDWWPIWTVHYGPVDAVYGAAAAVGMGNALKDYPVEPDTPVFLDVEQRTIDNSGRMNSSACVQAWIAGMARYGYLHAYAYCTDKVGGQWLPHWTNVRPDSLPGDLVGWQYGSYGAYDLSVFDDKILPLAVKQKPRRKPHRPLPRRVVTHYVVRAGDTLSSIAAQFHMHWQALYALNRQVIGPDPDHIEPGQLLTVHRSVRHYVVKAGDTLSSIAKEFGVPSWKTIYQANRSVIGANPDRILPGEVLMIP